ncbi:MAG: LVIVD repeat-containing protein [Actinomycetota bacterium]
MSSRKRSVLVAGATAILLMVPLGASPPAGAVEEEGTHSPNVTHVINHQHRERFLEGELGGGGSDIEFATLRVRTAAARRLGIGAGKKPFALAGSYDNGLQLVDISNPTDPVTVGVYDCIVRQGDVQVFKRGDNTYAAYTHDDPYDAGLDSTCYREATELSLFTEGTTDPAGTFIVDISNPAKPRTVSFISVPRGSHNQTVAPGGKYLYNSNSDLGRVAPSAIEIFDITHFSNPQSVGTLPLTTGLDSHDITFNEAGDRAYVAAITHSLVLDTTDLAKPKIIGRIIDPAINIHHQSDPVTLTDPILGERTFLVVTDELAGAAGNAVCPGGGLHVYDISGSLEQNPVKVGAWFSPGVRETGTSNLTCTSHVLRMYPEHGLMTIAWYNAGVRVVDISGLVGLSVGVDETQGNLTPGMKELGYYYFPDSDTWSVKTNVIEPDGSFYMYGNDLARGLDVYRFEAGETAARETGTWMSPAQALSLAQARGVTSTSGATGPYCLWRGLQVG